MIHPISCLDLPCWIVAFGLDLFEGLMFSLELDHHFLDPVRGVNRHKREERPRLDCMCRVGG